MGALPNIALNYEIVEIGGQEYFYRGFTPNGTFSVVLPGAGYYYAEEDAPPTSNDTTFQNLYFVVTQPGLSSASAFKGQYSFLYTGEQGASDTPQGRVAAIGSLTADGAGKITAGVLDQNAPTGALLDQPISGTYSLDATGVGDVILQTKQGSAKYALTGNPFEFVNPGVVLSASLTGSTDGASNSCSVTLQHPPPYVGPSLINGGYLLQLQGEKACTGTCSGPRHLRQRAAVAQWGWDCDQHHV